MAKETKRRSADNFFTSKEWAALSVALLVAVVGASLRKINLWLGYGVIVLAVVGVCFAIRALHDR